jgi:hypothetical protein
MPPVLSKYKRRAVEKSWKRVFELLLDEIEDIKEIDNRLILRESEEKKVVGT